MIKGHFFWIIYSLFYCVFSHAKCPIIVASLVSRKMIAARAFCYDLATFVLAKQ